MEYSITDYFEQDEPMKHHHPVQYNTIDFHVVHSSSLPLVYPGKTPYAHL